MIKKTIKEFLLIIAGVNIDENKYLQLFKYLSSAMRFMTLWFNDNV